MAELTPEQWRMLGLEPPSPREQPSREEIVAEAARAGLREVSDFLGLTTEGTPVEMGTAEGVADNIGYATTSALGAPVDALTSALNNPLAVVGTMAGRPSSAMQLASGTPGPLGLGIEDPIGGSASLRDAFGVPEEPEDSVLGNAAQLGTEGLLMALGGGAAGASRAAPAATGRLTTRPGSVAIEGRPPGVAPVPPTTAGDSIITGMGDAMLTHPLRTMTGEATAGAAAGAAGSVAEQAFPDSPGAQVMAELLGGFSPMAAAGAVGGAVRGTDWVLNRLPLLGAIRRVISPPGEARAQARFTRAVGGDRDEILARLEDETLPGLTYAQRSESPGLLSLEVSLANRTDAGKAERAAGLTEMREAILNETRGIAGSTDYEAARGYLSDLLDVNLRVAAQAADEAVARLGIAAGRQEINEAVATEVRGVLLTARETETQLYQAVPLDAQVSTEGTRAAYETILAQTPRAQQGDIPEIANRFLGREGRNDSFGDVEAVAQMQGLRSELLSVARNSRAGDNPNFNRARIAELLADALLTDMGAAVGQVRGEAGEALRTALNFSHELNQRFRQGPVGRLLGFARSGERGVAPELFLESSVGRGGPRGLVEQQAILAAADRTGAFSDLDLGDAQRVMRDSMNDYLRLRFKEMAVNSDGTLRDAGVRQFYSNDNGFGLVLEQSPEMRSFFDNIVRVGRTDSLARQTAASRTLTGPNASAAAIFANRPLNTAFSQVSQHSDPAGQMRTLVDMVRRDPSGRALAGLKTGFAEWVLSGGRQTAGEGWSLPSSETLMRLSGAETPTTDAQRRVLQMGEVLFSEEERARMRVIANTLRKVETASAAGPSVEGVVGDAPAQVRNFLASWLGVHIGSRIGVRGPGQIVVSSRAANFVRQVADRVLGDRAPRLIAEGITNGRLFREVLNAPIDTLPQQERVRQRLNAWLGAVAVEEGRDLSIDDEGFLLDQ